MVYSDGIHMIASTIQELHEFAKKIGLNKCYYRNPRKKKHPHYDLMTDSIRQKAIDNGVIIVTDREIVKFCREFYGPRVL